MRIALVSPYSWTYQGGVNRHVEALAEEFISRGREVRVLAPWDPSDRLNGLLHRGQAADRPRPDYLVSLGPTIGHGPHRPPLDSLLLARGADAAAAGAPRGELRRRPRARAAGAADRLGRMLVPR